MYEMKKDEIWAIVYELISLNEIKKDEIWAIV